MKIRVIETVKAFIEMKRKNTPSFRAHPRVGGDGNRPADGNVLRARPPVGGDGNRPADGNVPVLRGFSRNVKQDSEASKASVGVSIANVLRAHPRGVLAIALTLVMAFTGLFLFMPGRSTAGEYWESWPELGNLNPTQRQNLSGNYKVTAATTIPTPAAGVSGLKLIGNTTIYIDTPATLTVTGGPGSNATGGGAGILLPSTATLYIRGEGTLTATGGVAGNGTGGSSGIGANATFATDDPNHSWGYVDNGSGGAGGAGGGGAGAGIGTSGGAGGDGGLEKQRTEYSFDWEHHNEFDGSTGNPAGNGDGSATAGTLYVLDKVKVFANAGGAGNAGAAGSANTNPGVNGSPAGNACILPDNTGTNWYACGVGGGGGGGGAGGAAANIGSGGAGGGGGGSAGTGGIDWWDDSSWNDHGQIAKYATGAGGAAGAGWGNGQNGAPPNPSAPDKSGGAGGTGGQRGSAGGGGTYWKASTANVSTPVANNAAAATLITDPSKAFTERRLTYDDNTSDEVTNMPDPNPQTTYETNTAAAPGQYVSGMEPVRAYYDFLGWSIDNIAETPTYTISPPSIYALTGDKTLFAIWSPTEYTITYGVGESEGDPVTAPVPPPGSYTYVSTDVTLATAPVPTDDELIFTGWLATDASDAGFVNDKVYPSGAIIPLSGAHGGVTLTAQWIRTSGIESISEDIIIISGDAIDDHVDYVDVAIDTYLDGYLANMDSVELWQDEADVPVFKYSLAGEEGHYTFKVDEDEVGGSYKVYVDGEDTGETVSFAETPILKEIYYYTATVTTRLDGVATDAAVVLKKGSDELRALQTGVGEYQATHKVNAQAGDETDTWEIGVDGEDSGEAVTFASGVNTQTVDRYTLHVETWLDGSRTDSLGAVLLRAPPDSGKSNITPAAVEAGVFEQVGFAEDITPTPYTIVVGGRDTGETVTFTSGGRRQDVNFYTLEIETSVDGAPADIGVVTVTSGGVTLGVPHAGLGRYKLIGMEDAATTYAVYVDGAGTGKTVTFTDTGRTASAEYFTVTYHEYGGESGDPPVDDALHLSGAAVAVMPINTLVWPVHTFAGWQADDGAGDVYEPDDLFTITKAAVFKALWTDDTDAEASWIIAGENTAHYGPLRDALAAAASDGVDITLLKNCDVDYAAQLGADDTLTTSNSALEILSGGAITNAGIIDNSGGEILVGNHGALYNDNEVATAGAIHLDVAPTGTAVSLVTFDANGHGTSPAARYVPFNTTIAAITPGGVATGWTFEGWYLEAACLNPWTMGTGGDLVTNAVTLYASWSEVSYEVVFHVDDGGVSRGADPQERTVSVTYGAVLTGLAPVVTAAGFTRQDWVTSDGAVREHYNLAKPVTGPGLELYADWTRNNYEVTFNLNGKDAHPAPPPETIAFKGNVAEPTTPTVAGFDLTGWYRDSGATQKWDFDEDTMPADDQGLTLYAGWRPHTPVKVSFDMNGHSGTTPEAISVYPGETIDYPTPVPVSDEAYYSFSGWYTQPECYERWDFTDDTVPPVDSMTLYAGWSFDGYTVTFSLNGVSADRVTSPPGVQRLSTAGAIVEPTPAAVTPGYTLMGWYTDPGCSAGKKWDFDTGIVTGDLVLYADWDVASYYVTFDLNGHPSATPAPSPNPQTVTYGALVTRPTDLTDSTGYTFLGWYTTTASIAAEHRWSFLSDTMPDHAIDLYAGWRSGTAVRVDFNMNGHGVAPADQWVEPGASVSRPAIIIEAEGYDFGDWYQDKACTAGSEWVFAGEPGTETPVPTSGASIYAKWTAVTRIVHFDMNGHGVQIPEQPTSYGAMVAEPSAPAATGYTFLGWYKDKATKDKWVFENDTMPAGDQGLTLYAGWRDNRSVKILFDPNLPAGATLSGGAIDAAWVLPGELAPEPTPTPYAAGYDFGGWYRDKACTPGQQWIFPGAYVSGAMTLYAKWTIAPCTVYFSTGGKSVEPAPVVAFPGDKITPPETPTAPALSFKGWYASDEYGQAATPWNFLEDTVPQASTLVLSALWAPVGSHEVSFDLNTTTSSGGFVGNPSVLRTPQAQWLMPGVWVDEPDVRTEGQYISGWYTTDSAVTPAERWDFINTTVGAVDVKLYAQWTQHIYELNYELNGHGNPVAPNPATVSYGALLTQITPTAIGNWVFEAWYEDTSLKKPWDFANDRMPAKEITLYAGWHSDQANKVEFNVNGHGTTPAAVWVEPNECVDEPEPGVSEEGYTFDGWYTPPPSETKWDFETEPVTGPMTLNAKWTPNSYNVSFDTSGFGNPNIPSTMKAGFDTTLTKPSPDPAQYGYVFGGWYKDEFCSNGEEWIFGSGGDPVPATDLTLYAKWTKGTFTASFNMNGHGGSAPPAQTVEFEGKVPEPAQPSETGWVFGGWFKDAACSAGAEWNFATNTMPGENMTLYAKWTEDVHAYTVYFVMNGHGGQAPNPVQVDVGARIPMPAQPYEAGYTFGGWYTDMACSPGHEWNFNTGAMPANDMTLFAKWTEDSSGGGGGGNSGGGSGGNNDKDKDKNKESDKDKNSGNDKSKDNAGNKANDAEGGSGGSGNGGSGNTSNAEGGGATTTDEAIDGIASDDDTYGEADADNASGEDSEWNTNGGSAEAGDDENGRGKGEEDMSFANIILMVAGIVIALFIAINAKRRRYKRWLLPVVIALGALGAVLYFVIEDIHGAWALINSHTIYFAIILAAQIAATIIAKRSKVDSGINPE